MKSTLKNNHDYTFKQADVWDNGEVWKKIMAF